MTFENISKIYHSNSVNDYTLEDIAGHLVHCRASSKHSLKFCLDIERACKTLHNQTQVPLSCVAGTCYATLLPHQNYHYTFLLIYLFSFCYSCWASTSLRLRYSQPQIPATPATPGGSTLLSKPAVIPLQWVLGLPQELCPVGYVCYSSNRTWAGVSIQGAQST